MDGTEVCAAEPPFTSGGFGEGGGGIEGWERNGSEHKLCYVGSFVDGDRLVGCVLKNNTDFSAIIIVDDASANVDVTEGETTA